MVWHHKVLGHLRIQCWPNLEPIYTRSVSGDDKAQSSHVNQTDYGDAAGILCSYKDHSIIRRIKSHVSQRSTFNFSPTTAKEVHDLLKNVDSKKATGYDNVPPKIIKMAADEFASPLTNLINLSIERSCFPSDLKKSELSPLYKCKDSLVSGNYRPLSILPSVSKKFLKRYIISNYTNILSMFYRTCYQHFGRDMGVNTYWQNW